MYLHLALPDRAQVDSLMSIRGSGCVSIYLATDPAGDCRAERIELGNLMTEAVTQLAAADHDRGEIADMQAMVDELLEDADFWAHQARSLAVFVTPGSLATYQLPNRLTNMVEVSDRLHLKPLLRSLTFPQAAYIVAISQNAVRILEVLPEGDPVSVEVPDLPASAVDAVGVPSISGRKPHGRVQGGEGQKMRLGQYCRAVDQALRPVLVGRNIPLILAANQPLESIYRQWNTYPNLVDITMAGNPDNASDGDLAASAREVLDRVYADELAALNESFEQRASEGRTATDVADVAGAATYGMVDTVFVDIDAVVPGFLDEDSGAVTFTDVNDAVAYGVVDEIARRTWLTGGRVLAVRRQDIPGGGDVAAILRWIPNFAQ